MPANGAHLQSAIHRVIFAALLILEMSGTSRISFSQELPTRIPEKIKTIRFKKFTSEQRRISGLRWSSKSLEGARTLELTGPDLASQWSYQLKIKGKWDAQNRVLISASPHAQILWNKAFPGGFTLILSPEEAISRVTLIAVGPLGETETQTLAFAIPNFERTPPALPLPLTSTRETQRVIAAVPPPIVPEPVKSPPQLRTESKTSTPKNKLVSTFPIQTGISFTGIQHTEIITVESALSDIRYQALALTGKASLTRVLTDSPWIVSTSVFATLASLNASRPDMIRYLGANARFGYSFQEIKPRLSLGLHGGAYWLTSFVSGSNYGFKNVAGPQLFPTLSYTLSERETLSGYFKFSPVSGGGLALLSTQNHEVALGFGYSEKRPSGKAALSGSLDISLLRLEFPTSTIEARTLSLGVGLGF